MTNENKKMKKNSKPIIGVIARPWVEDEFKGSIIRNSR